MAAQTLGMDRDCFEDEHEWFRETVAGFVARELMPRREEIREQRAIPRGLWLKAGQQGLLHHRLAVRGGIGALPLDDEAECRGRMTMRLGALPGHDDLKAIGERA